MEWNFGVIERNWPVFLEGLQVTLLITMVGCFFGTLLGLLLARGRLSKNPVCRAFSGAYVETFLGLPLLVLLIWVYFALPILVPSIAFGPIPSAILAISLNTSPFVAETLRAGIQAIPRGQVEAGLALGMPESLVFRRIVLPQAIATVLPPLLTTYISVLKLSSLASVIAVPELLHRAQNLSINTNRPLEVYTTLGLVYLAVIGPPSLVVRVLERRRSLPSER